MLNERGPKPKNVSVKLDYFCIDTKKKKKKGKKLEKK